MNSVILMAEFGTCILILVDESAAPVHLSGLTAAYVIQTVAVLIGIYRPCDSSGSDFYNEEHNVHIAAVIYAFSWAVDIANYFMTAYQVVPLAYALHVRDISSVS